MNAKKQTIESEKLLNAKELSSAVGLTVGFIKSAKDKYNLPHYKIGSMLRFKLPEVLAWIEQRKIAG